MWTPPRVDAPAAPPPAERLPEISSVRILLVDDDPQARALIEMALTDATFDPIIEVAPTARNGVNRIKADEHDIYLIDQRLPD